MLVELVHDDPDIFAQPAAKGASDGKLTRPGNAELQAGGPPLVMTRAVSQSDLLRCSGTLRGAMTRETLGSP